MRNIGLSTGTLALGDFKRGTAMVRSSTASAIELSALREEELDPLLAFLAELDVSEFSYISLHAPSRLTELTEQLLVEKLHEAVTRLNAITVHADIIEDPCLWRDLGPLLCIENMDARKATGRNADELSDLFEQIPDASFCFDIGHAHHIDATMEHAKSMLRKFRSRLRSIHFSEVDKSGHHVPLTTRTMKTYSRVFALVPQACTIIVESPAEAGGLGDQIHRVASFLSATQIDLMKPSRAPDGVHSTRDRTPPRISSSK